MNSVTQDDDPHYELWDIRGHGGVSIFYIEEFWSVMESVTNPNKKGVSQNIAISWMYMKSKGTTLLCDKMDTPLKNNRGHD